MATCILGFNSVDILSHLPSPVALKTDPNCRTQYPNCRITFKILLFQVKRPILHN